MWVLLVLAMYKGVAMQQISFSSFEACSKAKLQIEKELSVSCCSSLVASSCIEIYEDVE